jgi:uncharacterized protein with NRDE domain
MSSKHQKHQNQLVQINQETPGYNRLQTPITTLYLTNNHLISQIREPTPTYTELTNTGMKCP